MAKRQTKEEKLIDSAINKAYGASCAGVMVPIMSLPAIFAEGKKFYLEGKRDIELQTAIRKYVDTIGTSCSNGKR